MQPDEPGCSWDCTLDERDGAVLGHNPDPAKRSNFNIKQDEWKEGIFSGTHGSYWDQAGNLYVQDWNVAGRIMKLVWVK